MANQANDEAERIEDELEAWLDEAQKAEAEGMMPPEPSTEVAVALEAKAAEAEPPEKERLEHFIPLVSSLATLTLPLSGFSPVGLGLALAGATAIATSPYWGPSVFEALQDMGQKLGALQRESAQLSVSDTLTGQQQFLTTQQQTAGIAALNQMIAQAQVRATEESTETNIKTAMAAVAAGAIITGRSEDEIEERIRAAGTALALPKGATDTLVDDATRVFENTQARAREAAKAAEEAAQQAAREAAGAVGASVPGLGVIGLTGALSAASLLAIIPALANTFAKSGHSQTIACMGSTGSAILQGVMKTALPAAAATLFMVSPQIQEMISSFALKAVSLLTAPMESQAPITPEKAPGIGVYLLSQAVLMGAGAHLTSVTAEASAPLKNMGLGYLAAFMADMAGFSRIAAAFQGQMINWGLMQPMRYYSLEKFRPMIPNEMALTRLAGEYAITKEEFNKGMRYAGYSDDWIQKLYELADRPLTPMLFRYLGEAGILDEDLINRELRNAGYNEATIPYLKDWLTRVAAGETKGLYGSQVLRTYRCGLLADGDLKGHLGNLGFSGRQQDRAVYASRLDFATEQAEDTKALYKEQFKKGLIDEDDLTLAISSLGYRPEVVQIEVQRAITAVTPKVAKGETPEVKALMRAIQSTAVQAYIQLYRKEYIDEGMLFDYLVEAKLDPGLAEVTVTLEIARKLPKPEEEKPPKMLPEEKQVQSKLVQTYIELYRKDYISAEELLNYMLNAQVIPELAKATVAYEEMRKLPKVVAAAS